MEKIRIDVELSEVTAEILVPKLIDFGLQVIMAGDLATLAGDEESARTLYVTAKEIALLANKVQGTGIELCRVCETAIAGEDGLCDGCHNSRMQGIDPELGW